MQKLFQNFYLGMINKAHSQSDFEILKSAISQKQRKMVNKAHIQSDFEIFMLAISQKERNHIG